MTEPHDPPQARRGRRLAQFSLRTLLLGCLVVAVMTSGYLRFVAPYRAQSRAIARYKQLGGRVELVPDEGPSWQRWLVGDDDFVRIVSLDLKDTPATDEDLQPLAARPHLRYLRLWGSEVTDKGLQHIRGHTALTFLSLVDTDVSSEGLRHLAGLTNLERLYLRQTNVADDGMVHLRGLSNLAHLSLVFTNVEGEGLVHLADLPKLERLYLRDTGLNDVGLAHVMKLATLKHVSLTRTAVSDDLVEQLRTSHPDLEVVK